MKVLSTHVSSKNYQLPALTFSEVDKLEYTGGEGHSGITLVASLLIALMKDWMDAFGCKLRAADMTSTKCQGEYLTTCDTLREWDVDSPLSCTGQIE